MNKQVFIAAVVVLGMGFSYTGYVIGQQVMLAKITVFYSGAYANTPPASYPMQSPASLPLDSDLSPASAQ